MPDAFTASEIAKMIKEQAALSLGPWPRDLQLIIVGSGQNWACGLSPALQVSDQNYREGVMSIAKHLQQTVQLAR